MNTDTKRKLLAFPYWSSNPYLNVLYLASRADGWEILGAEELTSLVSSVETELEAGDVVHVHWTLTITDGVTTEAEANDRLQMFRRCIDVMDARGIKLLWTVHNEVAHDTPFFDVEKGIAEALADRAHVIIQLHDLTAKAVAHSYHLPADKLVTLRHSSYLGIYPDSVTDSDAREQLRVPLNAPTIGFFGKIRPYKGLETLFAAIDIAAERVDGLTFLLAGQVLAEDEHALEAALPKNVEIVRSDGFIPSDELAPWLRSSNAIALPYRKVLNSGSILLAATYDRPCIIPSDTPLAGIYHDEPWVHVYDSRGDAVRNLADAIVRLSDGDGVARQAARAYARAYTPYDMSRDYLRILDDLPAARDTRHPTDPHPIR